MLVVGLCVFFFSILKSVVYIRPCITFSRLSFETGIFCITFEMCFFVSVCESKKKSFDYDKHLLRKGIDRGKNLRVIEVERRIARGRVWKKLHLQTEQKRKENGSVACTYELTHMHTHTHPLSMNHLIQPGCIFAAYNPPGKTKGRTFGFDKMTENQNNNARFKANMRM